MRDGDERCGQHAEQPDHAETKSDDSVLLVTPADEEAVGELLAVGLGARERSAADDAVQMLERACSDADWLARLRRQGFEGPGYDVIKQGLTGYALPVVNAFVRDRTIYALTARRGRPVQCPEWVKRCLTRDDDDDRSELVAELLIDALVLLRRDGLMGGRWNPRLGASLPTYFVGSAVSVFPNTFRRWLREFTLGRGHEVLTDVVTDVSAPDDPEAVACVNDLLRRVLATMESGPLPDMIMALIRDRPAGEVAARHGISEAALKMRFHRWCKEIRDREEFR
jgi:DNA-directed RNA polymerase specialized sigma24 family protein